MDRTALARLGLAALLSLTAPASAAGQDVTVELSDGSTRVGRLTGWDGEALALSTSSGPARLPSEDVVLVTAAARPAEPGAEPARAPDVILMAPADGASPDRLAGELRGGDDFGVILDLGAREPVELAFDGIDRILPHASRPLDRLAGLADGGFDDRVWQLGRDGGLDGLAGVVARVEAGRVVLESGLDEVGFELLDVLAVVLAATEHPGGDLSEGGQRPVVRVATATGSLFAAGLLGLEDGWLGLTPAFSDELWLPLAELDAVWVESPDRVPFHAARVLEAEERPSLGGSDDVLFPWLADLSVSGRPLALDGVHRAGGFGVHAYSRLVLEIPEGALSARVRVGLSDEVAELPAQGSVRCELRVDGQRSAGGQLIREGDGSLVLRTGALGDARTLELVTDDGGDLDAGDRVAWVDGWFVVSATP